MKKLIIISGLLIFIFSSCEEYLQEEPTGFLTVEQFYTTPNQVRAAVNGAYVGLARPYTSVFLGLPIAEYYSFESMTGFSIDDFGTGAGESAFENLDIPDNNSYLQESYNNIYIPVANINSVIQNVSKVTIIDDATKNKALGELYFLRAFHYFRGVQNFGEIPLVTTPLESIDDVTVPKATVEKIYAQIVLDLTEAEKTGLPMTDVTGHVSMGAVKSLLAKVYLTMAGFPLNKGTAYYQNAYDKATELIADGSYNLFPEYANLRNPANKNKGEHIFMVQRQRNVVNNQLHYAMLPPNTDTDPDISVNQVFDPSLRPTNEFYLSYDAGDKRTEDKAYFYLYKGSKTAPEKLMNYKYWDDEGALAPPSGLNIPQLRYADILLVASEAKANVDGGATSDAVAVKAYYDVRKRAHPSEAMPASITIDQVLKERFWEMAFEYQIWHDMLRTRKTFDVTTKQIVPLTGHKATMHPRAFQESDFLLKLPFNETLKNPKLLEPAQ